MSTEIEKIQELIRHIKHVQDAGLLLGTRLIERGRVDLGWKLIARCFRHDNSKFYGIERRYISHTDDDVDRERIALAVSHHNQSNAHHPEYWEDISHMDEESIAEFVCDAKARSVEFGSSLIDWINEQATVKYNFTAKDKVYKKIMFFVKMLLGKEFKPLPKIQ